MHIGVSVWRVLLSRLHSKYMSMGQPLAGSALCLAESSDAARARVAMLLTGIQHVSPGRLQIMSRGKTLLAGATTRRRSFLSAPADPCR